MKTIFLLTITTISVLLFLSVYSEAMKEKLNWEELIKYQQEHPYIGTATSTPINSIYYDNKKLPLFSNLGEKMTTIEIPVNCYKGQKMNIYTKNSSFAEGKPDMTLICN